PAVGAGSQVVADDVGGPGVMEQQGVEAGHSPPAHHQHLHVVALAPQPGGDELDQPGHLPAGHGQPALGAFNGHFHAGKCGPALRRRQVLPGKENRWLVGRAVIGDRPGRLLLWLPMQTTWMDKLPYRHGPLPTRWAWFRLAMYVALAVTLVVL